MRLMWQSRERATKTPRKSLKQGGRSAKQSVEVDVSNIFLPHFHSQLKSDDDCGDGDRNEKEEPDLVAIAVGVQAEGQHEGDEVAQPLNEIA